ARYTGAEDFAVGTPVAGRDRLELEGLVGFFVNTLVLRGDLSGDPPFGILVVRAREALLAAHAHQDLPFERLVEELAPERDLGRTPLFQVLLASAGAQSLAAELPGLSLAPLDQEPRVAKFDLTFTLAPRALRLLYRTDLFDSATAERMAKHLAKLIEGALRGPDRRLSDLPLLGEVERLELVVHLNSICRDDPPDGTVHEAFAAQARRTPEAAAVVCSDRRLTFSELDRRARALAGHLQRLGVGPEVGVGLSCGRSPEAIVGFLGILFAGGAYVPIDPMWPAERVAWTLEDAQIAVVLTEERIAAAAERQEVPSCLPRIPGDGAAYVIYTSGSTGRPKGVVVRHRSVLNLARALREAVVPESEPLRVAVNASLSFDGSVKQLVQLLSGHSLHPVPEEVRLDAPAMTEWLRCERIDVVDVTPSQLRPLLEAGLSAAPEEAPGLVLVGGEVLDRETWEVARSRPWTRFVNVYGPTECTVDATALDLAQSRVPAAIGLPLPNVRACLVDRWGQPVPPGVPGELWIGGEGVARGYLGRPGLTAERFVPDPFGDEPGGRLYRSGDLARLGPAGAIEYLGRIDRQVKVRGYRIELGEVEAALRQLPEVRAAAVLEREGRLVAYVVGDLEADALRRSLRERLPESMVPAAFVTLAALPLTRNGKVDLQALPAPESQRIEEGYVAPRTPVEEILAGIWAELLGLERVGIADRFFDLGGHSLLAARVVVAVRDALQVDLPMRLVFEKPALEELARAIAHL
ncbi:MAG TPA: amino acid adenylation domain-containing protein, partial [Thermoanaerobaculia bacterium]|nr:amino acid adenylation domain-containing protein [Thermoanaerobaculia bacterium]